MEGINAAWGYFLWATVAETPMPRAGRAGRPGSTGVRGFTVLKVHGD